ncbi:hypothetical protein FACS1894132_09230 [Clostridia bacterium]|nr:hypothetical protein FACS1894132_09230 [Clostridia bacterium]
MPVISYKCPACGGEVTYNPKTKNFDCPFCSSSYSETEIKNIWKQNEETDLSKNSNEVYTNEDYSEHIKVYTCSSCGAEIVADDTTSATSCCYCHNPVILSGRVSGQYKPDKMLVFEKDRESAKEIFQNWTKKRWFVPKDFKKSVANITGIYVPYWLADCDTDSNMNAVGKVIRSYHRGNYQITETKEYSVERAANLSFIDVPADGSKKIDDDLLCAIEPYNYSEFKPFSMSYLSGFISNRFDDTKEDVTPRLKERVNQGSYDYLRGTISGYSSVSVSHSNCNIKSMNFEYALLPVWFLNHKYGGKDYEMVINGQTGKLAGTPPLSYKRLTVGSFILMALVFIIFLLSGLGTDTLNSSYIGLSVALSFIAAVIFFFVSKSKYKFKKQVSATNYLINPKLATSKDTFLRTYTTRTKIDKK